MQTPGDVHQALLEAGYTVVQQELDAGVLGSSSTAAIAAFQKANPPLVVDGICGPKTWAVLRRGPSKSDRFTDKGFRYSTRVASTARVVQQAVGDIGICEEPPGSNSGRGLAKFKNSGQPWCAYALSYWYGFAAEGGGCPWGRLGAVWDIADWAKAHGRVLPAGADLQPGDVGIVLRADHHGHVVLVVDADHDQVCTVGGNESNAVRGRVRGREAVGLYVRPIVV